MAKAEYIVTSCLQVEQPIGSFYCCVIDHDAVCEISHAEIRGPNGISIEEYIGIQRDLKASRIREIRQYVQNVDATFPSGVILAIQKKDIEYIKSNRQLKIKRGPKVAKIIDGQHRIRGLDEFEGKFQLICTIFVDMDIEDQAMTFGSINLAQTKVNKSIVYDLFDYQKSPSPQKTAHQIVRLLNREEDSPFFQRIKLLGRATGEQFQFLTQAAFVERLLNYISDDPMRDRNELKKGGLKKLPKPERSKASKLILRGLFAGKKDHIIADIMWTYFDAVRNRWQDAWDNDERGMILNRTQGFAAFMRFFGDVYPVAKQPDGSLDFAAVERILESIPLHDMDFNSTKYAPGSSGEVALYRELLSHAKLSDD